MSEQSTPTFEQHMRQLEQLVASLERGELPLDDALKAFEQGMKLVGVCKDQLAQAELKVEKVLSSSGAAEPFRAGE